MLLAVDMGNTNITIGVFDGEALRFESRLATDHAKMKDQYAIELLDILRLYRIEPTAFEGAILSSVVPSLDHTLCAAIRQVTGLQPLLVGPGTKTGINIRIDDPSQLGADLLVGAVAALAQYGGPCIVWDLGTATTASVVTAAGEFLGGAIMPGVSTSLESLIYKASLLQRIRLDAPPAAISTNTIDCMQSGSLFGTAAMIDGMCDRMERELGTPVKVIATGGLGREIIRHCRRDILYDDRLLLTGLRLIYEKNRK